jgi:hypothetical protein
MQSERAEGGGACGRQWAHAARERVAAGPAECGNPQCPPPQNTHTHTRAHTQTQARTSSAICSSCGSLRPCSGSCGQNRCDATVAWQRDSTAATPGGSGGAAAPACSALRMHGCVSSDRWLWGGAPMPCMAGGALQPPRMRSGGGPGSTTQPAKLF